MKNSILEKQPKKIAYRAKQKPLSYSLALLPALTAILLALVFSFNFKFLSDDNENKQDPNENDNSRENPDERKSQPKLPVEQKKVSDLHPVGANPLLFADPYEKRKGPGPIHGDDPHGDDLHDEKHFDPYAGTTPSGDDPYGGSTKNNPDHPNRPY